MTGERWAVGGRREQQRPEAGANRQPPTADPLYLVLSPTDRAGFEHSGHTVC